MSQSMTLAVACAIAAAASLLPEASGRPFLSPWVPPHFFSPKRNNNPKAQLWSHIVLSNLSLRGGESATSAESKPVDSAVSTENEEPSLDEKVNAAMRKLGLSPPTESNDAEDNEDCKDGVCSIPEEQSSLAETSAELDPHELAEELAKEFNVDKALAMAALGATSTFGEHNQRIFKITHLIMNRHRHGIIAHRQNLKHTSNCFVHALLFIEA